MPLFLVCLAGGIGSGLRYLMGVWILDRLGPAFPYGTIVVNLTGCFAMALAVSAATTGEWTPELRAAVLTGLLGGFTTYSSFNQETVQLFLEGSSTAALMNVGITLLGGLVAAWLGLALARQLTG
jgi:CrcB protein